LTSWATISFSKEISALWSCYLILSHVPTKESTEAIHCLQHVWELSKCKLKFIHPLFRVLGIQQAICKIVLLDFVHRLNYKITSNNRVVMTRMTAEKTTTWHGLKPQWSSGIPHKVVTAETRESLTEKFALNPAGPKPKTFPSEILHFTKPSCPLYQKSFGKIKEVYI
jgi:hypothetical protein